MHKWGQLGEGWFRWTLGPLLKTGLPLMKNVLKPLAKNVLIPLELTAAASATDATIQKKTFRSCMTTLLISNEEMNVIMKIVQSLEESALLVKDVSKQLKMKLKNKKAGFSVCY